ncbi:unnamed protein product [Prunus armeniaca]
MVGLKCGNNYIFIVWKFFSKFKARRRRKSGEYAEYWPTESQPDRQFVGGSTFLKHRVR